MKKKTKKKRTFWQDVMIQWDECGYLWENMMGTALVWTLVILFLGTAMVNWCKVGVHYWQTDFNDWECIYYNEMRDGTVVYKWFRGINGIKNTKGEGKDQFILAKPKDVVTVYDVKPVLSYTPHPDNTNGEVFRVLGFFVTSIILLVLAYILGPPIPCTIYKLIVRRL